MSMLMSEKEVAVDFKCPSVTTFCDALEHVTRELDGAMVPPEGRRGLVGIPIADFKYKGVAYCYEPIYPINMVCSFHEMAVFPPAQVVRPEGVAFAVFKEDLTAVNAWLRSMRDSAVLEVKP